MPFSSGELTLLLQLQLAAAVEPGNANSRAKAMRVTSVNGEHGAMTISLYSVPVSGMCPDGRPLASTLSVYGLLICLDSDLSPLLSLPPSITLIGCP